MMQEENYFLQQFLCSFKFTTSVCAQKASILEKSFWFFIFFFKLCSAEADQEQLVVLEPSLTFVLLIPPGTSD